LPQPFASFDLAEPDSAKHSGVSPTAGFRRSLKSFSYEQIPKRRLTSVNVSSRAPAERSSGEIRDLRDRCTPIGAAGRKD
jgi:hypothetical protein